MNATAPILVSAHASLRARGRFADWQTRVSECNRRICEEVGDAIRGERCAKNPPSGSARGYRVKHGARICWTEDRQRGYVIAERRRRGDTRSVVVVITALVLGAERVAA